MPPTKDAPDNNDHKSGHSANTVPDAPSSAPLGPTTHSSGLSLGTKDETHDSDPQASSSMSWPSPAEHSQPGQVISGTFAAPEMPEPPAAGPPQPTAQPVYGTMTPNGFVPAAAPPQAPAAKEPTNTGLLVLQWLTYAFWGWTILGLSILTGLVVANFIGDAETGSGMPYGIAAVLVLLPISFICDHFYSKQEPEHKTGAASILMVIHAVIFALFGIGSVIVAVISLVMMFTAAGDKTGQTVSLVTAAIVAVYYGITFLRTLNPKFTPWVQRYYKLVMVITVGIIALLGIIGPLARERATRDDKLISGNLSTVVSAINTYSRTNNKLPANLSELTLRGDAEELVKRNLLEYKPESSVVELGTRSTIAAGTTYRYQLCATFKEESSFYREYDDYNLGSDGYTTYASAYSHPAGRTCYKLKTSVY